MISTQFGRKISDQSDFYRYGRKSSYLNEKYKYIGNQYALVIASSFSIGFMEGCLHIKEKPIPLRFAIRFATVNILPSCVWQHISAKYIANVCSIPVEKLITTTNQSLHYNPTIIHSSLNYHQIKDGLNATKMYGKRGILLKTLRSLRYIVTSYGMAYVTYQFAKLESKRGDEEIEESVLRFAPNTSKLSLLSKQQHGDHVNIFSIMNRDQLINWSQNYIIPDDISFDGKINPLSIVEMEIQNTAGLQNAMELQKESPDGTQYVALLSTDIDFSPEDYLLLFKNFDVIIHGLSPVLQRIITEVKDQQLKHVYIHIDDLKEQESQLKILASLLAHEYNIKTSLISSSEIHYKAQDNDNSIFTSDISEVLVVTMQMDSDTIDTITSCGIPVHQILYIQTGNDISHANRWKDAFQKDGVHIFNITKALDSILQSIRNDYRAGKSGKMIQERIYRELGSPVIGNIPFRAYQYSSLDNIM